MAQTATVRHASAESPRQITWLLIVGSAVADLLAITGFLATLLRQDSLLILAIAIAASAVIGAVYRFHEAIGRLPLRVLGVYSAASLLLVAVVWSVLANTAVDPITVDIVQPQDRGEVTMRFPIQGTVSNAYATVYVLVRPLSVAEMWVQPLPVVDREGKWQVEAYFGGETIGIGERYQVIGLATSDNFLVSWATGNSFSEGQKITRLPRRTNKSGLVTVTRPK